MLKLPCSLAFLLFACCVTPLVGCGHDRRPPESAADATVEPSSPTIDRQPVNAAVTALDDVVLSVAGRCSSGVLRVQWQRSKNGDTFDDIAGATADTYSLTATEDDNGAEFRARLSCGDRSTTSSRTAAISVSASPLAAITPPSIPAELS